MKSVAKIIKQIDFLKKELNQLRPISPEREAKIKQTFRLWWNYHSNAIEGNQLTLGETISLILHDLTAKGKSYKDHREVKGHNEALLWVDDIVKENRPLTQNFIRELHQTLLKEPYESPAITPTGQIVQKTIKIGEYKTTPNHVRTPTGEIYHYALPEEVPARIDDLLRWYESAKKDTYPLILAATFHYDFVKIHPFDDGNGRMSRILMNLILMQGGYPPAIIKMEKRSEYLAALSEADAGDLEKFIFFVGESLLNSTKLYIQGAKGESIGEADDLDKKIALLKLELKKNPKITDSRIKRNIQTEQELFEKSLKPLFLKLKEKLFKFDELFLSVNHRLTVKNTTIKYENILTFEKEEFSTLIADTSQIVLHFSWIQPIFNTKNLNSIIKHITISFKDYHYQIQTADSKDVSISEFKEYSLSNEYDFQVTKLEIDQIVTVVAEAVLTKIQKHTQTKIS